MDNQGLSFVPSLPLQKALNPARILVADDNADMLEYLSELLSSRWVIETAADGEAVLQAIRRQKPDLLLTDVLMPGIDGFELVRRLREDPTTRDLPVILVSARAGEEARVEGLERGADDYLVKPFSARELLARIDSRLVLATMRGEMQRKITGILESMTGAFWAVDRDWQITYANQAAAQLVSLAAASTEQVDNRLNAYFQTVLSAENMQLFQQAMHEQKTLTFEQFHPVAQAWLQYRAYPYESGLAIHAADITIEKNNTEALLQVEMQHRLLENREKERQEIARNIHDGPIQTLVSAIFNTEFAKDAINDPLAKVELEQIGFSLKAAVRELREVVNELRPPALIRFGLAKAMRVYLVDFQEKHPELTFHLDLQDDGNLLSEMACLALYRVFQEGLNNIVRHSGAAQVWMHFHPSPEQVLLEIQDDGVGFRVPDQTSMMKNSHFGLAGMKERIEAIHGRLKITSVPGQGTLLRITIP